MLGTKHSTTPANEFWRASANWSALRYHAEGCPNNVRILLNTELREHCGRLLLTREVRSAEI